MSEQNGYVKMSLFWKIVGGASLIFMALTGYVIANDRTRAVEDVRITERVDCKLDKISYDITEIKVAVAKLAK